MCAALTLNHEQKYNGSRMHPTMNWEATPDMGTGPGTLLQRQITLLIHAIYLRVSYYMKYI